MAVLMTGTDHGVSLSINAGTPRTDDPSSTNQQGALPCHTLTPQVCFVAADA